MTSNKYWRYLEQLRRSGKINMYCATPYLMQEFGIDKPEAVRILADWMRNYNPNDYTED